MGKKIAWTDEAKANLRAIDQATALRILHVVARYLATGEGDVNASKVSNLPNCVFASATTASAFADTQRFHPGARRKTPP